MAQDLEKAFGLQMEQIYFAALKEAKYRATRYLQMVHERGGLATAHYLLAQPNISDGFAELWQRGRLDLTVEALVLKEPWCSLFTEDELAVARKRLEDRT